MFDSVVEKLTPRRILVALLLVCIGVGVYYLYSWIHDRPLPVTDTVFASEIVTSNTESVSMTGDKPTYFTGSNQVVLSDTQSGESSALFSEVAYESPRKSVLDSNGKYLLVSVNYSGTSDFFQLPSIEPGIRWVATDTKGKTVAVQPFTNQILDATIHNGVVYGLRVVNNDTSALFSYSLKDNQLRELNDVVPVNNVVGATDKSIITRTASGDIYIYNDRGDEIANIGTVGSAYIDDSTSSLIIADNREDSKRYKVAVFDATTGKKRWDVRGEYKYLSVGGGNIVLYNQNIQPDLLIVYDLDNGAGNKYAVRYSDERNTSAIASILVQNQSPVSLIITTTSSQLLVASTDEATINKIPVYSYPTVSAPEDNGVFFQSTPGNLDLTVITQPDRLQESIQLLRQTCGCNPHQFRKTWLSIDEYNRPASAESGEFTGDGVPPELQ